MIQLYAIIVGFSVWISILIYILIKFEKIAQDDNGGFDKKEFYIMFGFVTLWFFVLAHFVGLPFSISHWIIIVVTIGTALGLKFAEDIRKLK